MPEQNDFLKGIDFSGLGENDLLDRLHRSGPSRAQVAIFDMIRDVLVNYEEYFSRQAETFGQLTDLPQGVTERRSILRWLGLQNKNRREFDFRTRGGREEISYPTRVVVDRQKGSERWRMSRFSIDTNKTLFDDGKIVRLSIGHESHMEAVRDFKKQFYPSLPEPSHDGYYVILFAENPENMGIYLPNNQSGFALGKIDRNGKLPVLGRTSRYPDYNIVELFTKAMIAVDPRKAS